MTKDTIKFSELTGFFDKQKLATKMADQYRYLLYGGAAGPGKSYWLRWYPIRQLIKWHQQTGMRGIRAAMFCEDYPTLKDRQVSKMQYEYPSWLGTLKDDGREGLGFFLKPDFGSGALILRNLDDPSKYLSSEFALIAIDELTRNDEEIFNRLRSRLRWKGIERTQFVAATNPGEIGHEWVKKRWVDKVFPLEEREKDQFFYVPALPKDNPHLSESYMQALRSLPEKLRKAYLEGNWDVFEGQFFSEWDKTKHIVEPFAIPLNWRRFRSIDVSGLSGITSCHWYALDYDGNVYAYREHYRTGLTQDQHAKEIMRLSEGEDYVYTVIDCSAFDKIGLPETIAEVYLKNGITNLVPSSKNRVQGWDFMHQYLFWEEREVLPGQFAVLGPKLKFFSNCVNATRTIPILIHDEHRGEDVDTDGEDHAADEVRYFLQTLRQVKSPRSKSLVEIRLDQLKQLEEDLSFSYAR